MSELGIIKSGNSSSNFEHGGSERYMPNFFQEYAQKREELLGIEIRTKQIFNTHKDPIYVAFNYVDKQPISKLASEFVKDNIQEPLIMFISKVTKTLS